MKIIFFLCVTTLFLYGCGSSSNDFDKKMNCQLLNEQAMDQIETEWGKVENGTSISGMQVEKPQIYYSPKLDSCIYYSEVIQKRASDPSISATYYFKIKDLMNNEELWSKTCNSFTSLIDPKYENIPQHTPEDMQMFSECTKEIDEKLIEFGVK